MAAPLVDLRAALARHLEMDYAEAGIRQLHDLQRVAIAAKPLLYQGMTSVVPIPPH